MKNTALTKRAIQLVGTILIGALGSALWDVALKPSLLFLGTFMLDVATLGLNSLRDGMYADAAKGNVERASVSAYLMIVGVFSGLLCAPLIIHVIERRAAKPAGPRPERNASRTIRTDLWLVPLAIGLSMSVQAFRINYVITAAAYFEQLERIVAPFVSAQDRLQFESRFARLTTRQEYVQLVDELRGLARDNKVSTPTFAIY